MESRQTFRSIVTDEAWQYKIRVEKEKQWLESGKERFWEKINLDLKKSIVKEVNRKIAEKIILEYEWLGDMAVTNKYYGIFFDSFCGGVICINTFGSNKDVGKMFGIESRFVSYFARGACPFWTPKGAASKLLSFALKFEKRRGAKVAIAYSDNDAGEYGTVYQATNWVFCGYGNKKPQYVKGNRILDSRTWQGMYYKDKTIKKRLVKEGWKMQLSSAKGRYVYILAEGCEKEKIYRKIKPLIKPYPKRPHICVGSSKVEHSLSSERRQCNTDPDAP